MFEPLSCYVNRYKGTIRESLNSETQYDIYKRCKAEQRHYTLGDFFNVAIIKTTWQRKQKKFCVSEYTNWPDLRILWLHKQKNRGKDKSNPTRFVSFVNIDDIETQKPLVRSTFFIKHIYI